MSNNLSSRIALNISAYRNTQGVSQAELAKAVGVTQSYISQLENGDRVPSLDILEKVCKALDLRIHLVIIPDEEILDREFARINRGITLTREGTVPRVEILRNTPTNVSGRVVRPDCT